MYTSRIPICLEQPYVTCTCWYFPKKYSLSRLGVKLTTVNFSFLISKLSTIVLRRGFVELLAERYSLQLLVNPIVKAADDTTFTAKIMPATYRGRCIVCGSNIKGNFLFIVGGGRGSPLSVAVTLRVPAAETLCVPAENCCSRRTHLSPARLLCVHRLCEEKKSTIGLR